VRTDLSDAHLYIFDRAALLRVLEVRPAFVSIKQVSAPEPLRSLSLPAPYAGACILKGDGIGSSSQTGQRPINQYRHRL